MNKPRLTKPGLPIPYKDLASLLSQIGTRVTGNPKVFEPHDHWQGRMYYLWEGYWRIIVETDDDGNDVRIHLVNSDRTPEEIATVEQSLAILLHLHD